MRRLGSFLPGEVVGSSGVHWSGYTWRWTDNEFKIRTLYEERNGKNYIPADMTIQDWGVTYAELKLYITICFYLYFCDTFVMELGGESDQDSPCENSGNAGIALRLLNPFLRAVMLLAANVAHAQTASTAPVLSLSKGPGQAYPTKPVRILIPVPAGGTVDVLARMLTPAMSNLLGQQMVIDNRGGAGGMIGTELAAKAAPDGYTLLMCSQGPITILPHLQKSVPYDTLRDFAAVSLISAGPYLLVTQPGAPFKTVKELIAAAKAEPGKINYASAGNGAPNHLASELFKNMAGINLLHVPYKGAPQSVTDVLGGHVRLNFGSIPPLSPHVKAGRLRALGVSSTQRTAQMPELPTISEAGVPGYEFYAWFGLLAPAKTPKPHLQRIHETLLKALRAPETASQFEAQGADPVGNSPGEFAAFLRREYDKYASVVRTSGLKVD